MVEGPWDHGGRAPGRWGHEAMGGRVEGVASGIRAGCGGEVGRGGGGGGFQVITLALARTLSLEGLTGEGEEG